VNGETIVAAVETAALFGTNGLPLLGCGDCKPEPKLHVGRPTDGFDIWLATVGPLELLGEFSTAVVAVAPADDGVDFEPRDVRPSLARALSLDGAGVSSTTLCSRFSSSSGFEKVNVSVISNLGRFDIFNTALGSWIGFSGVSSIFSFRLIRPIYS
jgi:hypothetical protein